MSDDLYLKAWRDAVYAYGGMSSDCDEELLAAAILRERFIPRVTGPHDGLIERLGAAVKGLRDFYQVGAVELIQTHTMEEAAAAIASLQAELDEVRANAALIVALRNDALRIITQQEDEIERLKSQRDFLANELREARAALENRNDLP